MLNDMAGDQYFRMGVQHRVRTSASRALRWIVVSSLQYIVALRWEFLLRSQWLNRSAHAHLFTLRHQLNTLASALQAFLQATFVHNQFRACRTFHQVRKPINSTVTSSSSDFAALMCVDRSSLTRRLYRRLQQSRCRAQQNFCEAEETIFAGEHQHDAGVKPLRNYSVMAAFIAIDRMNQSYRHGWFLDQ